MSGDKILFTPDCIFCNKVESKQLYKKGQKKVEKTSKFEFEGGETVKWVAEEKEDETLLTRIRGKILFSVEAHYHPSCRKTYTRLTGVGRSSNTAEKKKQQELEKTMQMPLQLSVILS